MCRHKGVQTCDDEEDAERIGIAENLDEVRH